MTKADAKRFQKAVSKATNLQLDMMLANFADLENSEAVEMIKGELRKRGELE